MARNFGRVRVAVRRHEGEPSVQHVQQGFRTLLHPGHVPAGHRVHGRRAAVSRAALPRVSSVPVVDRAFVEDAECACCTSCFGDNRLRSWRMENLSMDLQRWHGGLTTSQHGSP